jgi:CRP/FNR family transcriptional regulator, cyclic AMP receptor protein
MVDRAGGMKNGADTPMGFANMPGGWRATLPLPLAEACNAALQPRHFEAGEMLYTQGEASPGLFGIVSGTVQTIGLSTNGHPTLLSINRAGDWTGFLGVLDGRAAPFATVAASPVDALLLPGAAASVIFGASADTLALLAAPLVQILRVTFDYLIETNNRAPRRVVARRLLDLSRCAYAPGSPPGPNVDRINQASVAAATYLTRQTVNRTLRALAAEGLIGVGYGRIDIVNVDGLERAATGSSKKTGAAARKRKEVAGEVFQDGPPLSGQARDRLASEGWLPTLPKGLRDRILDRLLVRRCVRGEMLYRRGDPALGLYSVASGQCRTSAVAADGREYLFSLIHPGSWSGFASMLDEGRQPFSVEATSPATAVLLPGEAVRELFFRDAESYLHLLGPALGMLRAIYDHLVEGNFGPPERVIARRLYDLARLPYIEGDTPRSFVESLTQDDLAAATGLSRPTVNRVVVALEASGIIGRGYGRVTIKDAERLFTLSRPAAG